jgi:ABC-type Na+ efflux pump permease subunit
MRDLLVIVKREIRAVTRERTILLAVVIQLIIASMSSLLLMGLIAYYDPGSLGEGSALHAKIGVTGDAGSPFVRLLRADPLFVVTVFGSQEDAVEAYRAGLVDAIVYVPAAGGDTVDLKLYLPPSDSRSSVLLMMLNEPLKKYENQLREAHGIRMEYAGLQGKPNAVFEMVYTLILPMLMLFPGFIAGSIVIDSLTEEFEGRTLETLLSAPLSAGDLLAGKLAAAVLVAAAQCVLWPALLYLNGITVANVPQVLLVALAIAAMLSLFAAFVAAWLKDRERAQLAYAVGLIGAGGAAFLMDPSPYNLIARLALGQVSLGIWDVAAYLVPVVVIFALLMLLSRKIIAARA